MDSEPSSLTDATKECKVEGRVLGTLRIKAEIMVEHFEPETLARVSGGPIAELAIRRAAEEV